MGYTTVDELRDELLHLYEEAHHPFPYAGCRKLLRETGKRYEGLIPDLDLYFSDIASYCGGVKRVLQWPQEKIQEARRKLSPSFWDRYPEYQPLEQMVTQQSTPDLYADMALYERMRLCLLDLLSRLLKEQYGFDAVGPL
jgi:hypothetical protein